MTNTAIKVYVIGAKSSRAVKVEISGGRNE